MKSKFIFFSLLIISTNFIPVHCFSQSAPEGDITDIPKVNFFNPGISYEKRIGKLQSLMMQGFLNTEISISFSSSLGNSVQASFDPAFSLQYRYYYNYTQRHNKGKRTDLNSLNYVAPLFQTVFTTRPVATFSYYEFKRRPLSTLGIVWGLQRNYTKRFSLDLNVGLGYNFGKETTYYTNGTISTKTTSQVSVVSQLSLGFWLNNKM